MNPLSDKQLQLNQTFIQLIIDYQYSCEDDKEDFDSKGLMKYIWNRGYMLREKDWTIYE